jgi:ribosomal subunit interface protein
MQVPVQIVFHDLSHSDALESVIRDRARKLESVHSRLMRCHVSIEQPHRHSQQGNSFNVRLTLHVPGGEIVVNRDEHEDVYAAVREAFDVAHRQLEEHARKTREDVRRRNVSPAG